MKILLILLLLAPVAKGEECSNWRLSVRNADTETIVKLKPEQDYRIQGIPEPWKCFIEPVKEYGTKSVRCLNAGSEVLTKAMDIMPANLQLFPKGYSRPIIMRLSCENL